MKNTTASAFPSITISDLDNVLGGCGGKGKCCGGGCSSAASASSTVNNISITPPAEAPPLPPPPPRRTSVSVSYSAAGAATA